MPHDDLDGLTDEILHRTFRRQRLRDVVADQGRHPQPRGHAGAPGLVAAPWTKDWDAQHAAIAKLSPLKRSATADECAEAILACARNRYMSGAILVIDGAVTQVL